MLPDNLRKIRKEHKLTQQNIADVLGIDRTTYTFYEIGTTTPSPMTLHKLSQIYDVTVGYLMGVEENNPELKKDREVDFVSSLTDSFSVLSKNERELIINYRVLEPDSKAKILGYLKELVKQEKEKK